MTGPVFAPARADLDIRYGAPDATPTAWETALERLDGAEIFWLSTVRPDGRPHVTPLIAVRSEGAMCFTTGAEERKARNLAQSPQCVLTTGCNEIGTGLDLVLEGEAVRVTDDAALHRVAAAFLAKYGETWHFEVADGAFHHEGGTALVYEVAPVVAFGFGKGAFSQTRWSFTNP